MAIHLCILKIILCRLSVNICNRVVWRGLHATSPSWPLSWRDQWCIIEVLSLAAYEQQACMGVLETETQKIPSMSSLRRWYLIDKQLQKESKFKSISILTAVVPLPPSTTSTWRFFLSGTSAFTSDLQQSQVIYAAVLRLISVPPLPRRLSFVL